MRHTVNTVFIAFLMLIPVNTAGAAFDGPPHFVRGDANGDGSVDQADASTILTHLFVQADNTICPDVMDSDDSGAVDISDAINILNFLFVGTGEIAFPYPEAGLDMTTDDPYPCGDVTEDERRFWEFEFPAEVHWYDVFAAQIPGFPGPDEPDVLFPGEEPFVPDNEGNIAQELAEGNDAAIILLLGLVIQQMDEQDFWVIADNVLFNFFYAVRDLDLTDPVDVQALIDMLVDLGGYTNPDYGDYDTLVSLFVPEFLAVALPVAIALAEQGTTPEQTNEALDALQQKAGQMDDWWKDISPACQCYPDGKVISITTFFHGIDGVTGPEEALMVLLLVDAAFDTDSCCDKYFSVYFKSKAPGETIRSNGERAASRISDRIGQLVANNGNDPIKEIVINLFGFSAGGLEAFIAAQNIDCQNIVPPPATNCFYTGPDEIPVYINLVTIDAPFKAMPLWPGVREFCEFFAWAAGECAEIIDLGGSYATSIGSGDYAGPAPDCLCSWKSYQRGASPRTDSRVGDDWKAKLCETTVTPDGENEIDDHIESVTEAALADPAAFRSHCSCQTCP